ncbi:MAG: DUF6057 family protein [Rikenellaceae bacterium]
MRYIKRPIFILLVVIAVIFIFSNGLNYIIEKFHINGYYAATWDFAKEYIFNRGGIACYLSLMFLQSTSVLLVSLVAVAAIIALALSLYSRNRIDALSLALGVVYLAFRDYTSDGFLEVISSALLISLVVILSKLLPLRKVIGKLVLLLLIAALLFVISFDKQVIFFAVATLLYLVVSNFLLPMYRERILSAIVFVIASVTFVLADFNSKYDPMADYTLKMEQAAILGQWEKVLELNRGAKVRNVQTCYYTNIALLKTGKLSSQLFSHTQYAGNKGFELPNFFHRLNDVVYDAIGLPNLALRSTYENYSFYGRNHANIERLAYYYKRIGNNKVHDKFIALLPYSVENDNKEHHTTIGVDSILTSKLDSVLVPTLELIVKNDKENKSAFEVLMACYALEGRVVRFANYIDSAMRFFPNGLPQYYQELLVVYEEYKLRMEGSVEELPIDQKVRDAYTNFKNKKGQAYSQSYWYYSSNVNPAEYKYYPD